MVTRLAGNFSQKYPNTVPGQVRTALLLGFAREILPLGAAPKIIQELAKRIGEIL